MALPVSCSFSTLPTPDFSTVDSSMLLGLDFSPAPIDDGDGESSYVLNDAMLTSTDSSRQDSSQGSLDPGHEQSRARKRNQTPYARKTARAKQYNVYIRGLIDGKLDCSLPISQQPDGSIEAILAQVQDDFPEFIDCSRKRIRTYLKTCRRNGKSSEDQHVPMSASNSPSANIQCNVAASAASLSLCQKLTPNDFESVRQLAKSYRQSATLLLKAAEQLEQLIPT
eukprot:m.11059 g.11059  ORF g.11059 m.11059 type:complete len:225 (+) comp22944_c0_seq2:176-850(+)